MRTRLTRLIQKYRVLYEYQFCFREHHSANMALVELVDKIAQVIKSGKVVLGVFLDFRKAFDTVSNHILLQRLCAYGIRGEAHQWFSNY